MPLFSHEQQPSHLTTEQIHQLSNENISPVQLAALIEAINSLPASFANTPVFREMKWQPKTESISTGEIPLITMRKPFNPQKDSQHVAVWRATVDFNLIQKWEFTGGGSDYVRSPKLDGTNTTQLGALELRINKVLAQHGWKISVFAVYNVGKTEAEKYQPNFDTMEQAVFHELVITCKPLRK